MWEDNVGPGVFESEGETREKHAEDGGGTTEDVRNTLKCVSNMMEDVRDGTEYGSNEMKDDLNIVVEKNKGMSDGGWDVTDEICRGRLVRAILRNYPCDDDKDIEEKTEPGEAEDDRRNGRVNLPKIAG